MVDTRNPNTEGKFVTMVMVGPASYTLGAHGNTWTFREVRNIRRIVDIRHDPAAALAGGAFTYWPIVIVNDGQGNTRFVEIFRLTHGTPCVWAEVPNLTDLSAVNFKVEVELAEGV